MNQDALGIVSETSLLHGEKSFAIALEYNYRDDATTGTTTIITDGQRSLLHSLSCHEPYDCSPCDGTCRRDVY